MKTTKLAVASILVAVCSMAAAVEDSQLCLDSKSALQANETLMAAFDAVNTEFSAVATADICNISETTASCFFDYQTLDSYEQFRSACAGASGVFITTDYNVLCRNADRENIALQYDNAPGCAGKDCDLGGQYNANLKQFLAQLLARNLTCVDNTIEPVGDGTSNNGSGTLLFAILVPSTALMLFLPIILIY